MTEEKIIEGTYSFRITELQSRAIKVALMPQGDINSHMSEGLNLFPPFFS